MDKKKLSYIVLKGTNSRTPTQTSGPLIIDETNIQKYFDDNYAEYGTYEIISIEEYESKFVNEQKTETILGKTSGILMLKFSEITESNPELIQSAINEFYVKNKLIITGMEYNEFEDPKMLESIKEHIKEANFFSDINKGEQDE